MKHFFFPLRQTMEVLFNDYLRQKKRNLSDLKWYDQYDVSDNFNAVSRPQIHRLEFYQGILRIMEFYRNSFDRLPYVPVQQISLVDS